MSDKPKQPVTPSKPGIPKPPPPNPDPALVTYIEGDNRNAAKKSRN